MTQQPLTPTSDERVLAAIAHFFGFLVALIIWAFQKDKSRFIRFQSIQAMAFDLLILILAFVVVGCMVFFIFGALAVGVGDIAILGSQANPSAEAVRTLIALMTGVPLLLPCIFLPFIGAIFIAKLIATIQTFQGKDFHYPWLGDLVERSIGN